VAKLSVATGDRLSVPHDVATPNNQLNSVRLVVWGEQREAFSVFPLLSYWLHELICSISILAYSIRKQRERMFHSKFRLVVLASVLFLVGCSDASRQQQAEVSGTVTYRGKPLPGGIVMFISDKGFQNSATIDENGHYTILVSVGSNKITVDNRLLNKNKQTPAPRVKADDNRLQKKSQPIPESPRLKPPEGTTQETTLAGTYVPIRESYASAESSGLVYTVVTGTQVKDIPLE
jgi:hypothetical protein